MLENYIYRNEKAHHFGKFYLLEPYHGSIKLGNYQTNDVSYLEIIKVYNSCIVLVTLMYIETISKLYHVGHLDVTILCSTILRLSPPRGRTGAGSLAVMPCGNFFNYQR